jgi:hypothetical protein
LIRIATHLVGVIHPDGSVPTDRISFDRRHLELRRNGDGSYSVNGRLTGPVGAALFSVLQPLARPRVDSTEVTTRRTAGRWLPKHLRTLVPAGCECTTRSMTSALGCSALGRSRCPAAPRPPGCAHPPEWCDRHHIDAWIAGGLTDVSNLTLLCRYHHGNFVRHGWTCRLNAAGVPEWIPPRWIDPEQRPLTNRRIDHRGIDQLVRRSLPDKARCEPDKGSATAGKPTPNGSRSPALQPA